MTFEAEIELQKVMQPWYDKYPERRLDLLESASLFVGEVQDGGSWENEMDHLVESLNDDIGGV